MRELCAIIVFHDLVANATTLGTAGQVVYDYLMHNSNLFLMLGGHLDTEYTPTTSIPTHTLQDTPCDSTEMSSIGPLFMGHSPDRLVPIFDGILDSGSRG
jgi:hypothetical protein